MTVRPWAPFLLFFLVLIFKDDTVSVSFWIHYTFEGVTRYGQRTQKPECVPLFLYSFASKHETEGKDMTEIVLSFHVSCCFVIINSVKKSVHCLRLVWITLGFSLVLPLEPMAKLLMINIYISLWSFILSLEDLWRGEPWSKQSYFIREFPRRDFL